MFGLSFSEIMIIGFVLLLIIRPEDLPKLARTAGRFYANFQRVYRQIIRDLNSMD